MADPKQSFDITKLFVPIVVLSVGGLFGWVIKTESNRFTREDALQAEKQAEKDAHHERHEIQEETHNLLREAKEDIMRHHDAMKQRIGRMDDELSERITRLEALHMTPAKRNHSQTE